MTLSKRIRRIVEVAMVMGTVAAPSFAQSAHGYISKCDQRKAASNYADELKSTRRWWRVQEPSHEPALAQRNVAPSRSSLEKYCIGELLLDRQEYQASMKAYRDSLAGDRDAAWTKVWSLIQMGKIFDATNQRKRAVAQYKLAMETGDNTDGAMDQARALLERPFVWPGN
jgi:tetratricopeptide (TPR) repeat protein